MSDLQQLTREVEKIYQHSQSEFAQWMWKHHVPVVAALASELCSTVGASADLAVAGALLHDFGDAFVHRHAHDHEQITTTESTKLLTKCGYSAAQIMQVLDEVIAPHSCRGGVRPHTLEGQVLATADALAHLSTDFYLQFAWLHLPENKTYEEYVVWVREKIRRDFHEKICFDESRSRIKTRYDALCVVFG